MGGQQRWRDVPFDHRRLRDKWYRDDWYSDRTCLDAF